MADNTIQINNQSVPVINEKNSNKYDSEQEKRTKAVTASTRVLAVKKQPYTEVLFYYMSYALIFLFTAGQASLSSL